MSDLIEDLFSPDLLAELRAQLLASTGQPAPEGASDLLAAYLDDSIRTLASKLDNLEGLIQRLAQHAGRNGGRSHAVYTFGQASEAVSSAKRLLIYSAIVSLKHALICDHDNEHEEEPPCSIPTN